MHQNSVFRRFIKNVSSHPVPQVVTSLGKGVCLGSTLDLVAKKLAGKPKEAIIRTTARGQKLQQKYIDCRNASIEKLRKLYTDLSAIQFKTPVRYFELHEFLCKKWAITIGAINKRAKREFMVAKKIFERRKLRGNRRNLTLYKKFFKKINEYALKLVEEIPENLVEELGLQIIPIATSEKIFAETFIRNLKVITRKFRKHPHAIVEFQNDIEKSHHVIYCSFSPPYELQDANFPGLYFQTDDLAEFQLLLTFWSCFYNFSAFKGLYKVTKNPSF